MHRHGLSNIIEVRSTFALSNSFSVGLMRVRFKSLQQRKDQIHVVTLVVVYYVSYYVLVAVTHQRAGESSVACLALSLERLSLETATGVTTSTIVCVEMSDQWTRLYYHVDALPWMKSTDLLVPIVIRGVLDLEQSEWTLGQAKGTSHLMAAS